MRGKPVKKEKLKSSKWIWIATVLGLILCTGSAWFFAFSWHSLNQGSANPSSQIRYESILSNPLGELPFWASDNSQTSSQEESISESQIEASPQQIEAIITQKLQNCCLWLGENYSFNYQVHMNGPLYTWAEDITSGRVSIVIGDYISQQNTAWMKKLQEIYGEDASFALGALADLWMSENFGPLFQFIHGDAQDSFGIYQYQKEANVYVGKLFTSGTKKPPAVIIEQIIPLSASCYQVEATMIYGKVIAEISIGLLDENGCEIPIFDEAYYTKILRLDKVG